MEGHLWKTPREAVESSPIQRQRYESVGKDGAKGRGWISQTFNGLREFLSAVARSQERKLPRLEAAEAKCNELQHRWGPRAAETKDGCDERREAGIDLETGSILPETPQNGAEHRRSSGPKTSSDAMGRGITGSGKPSPGRSGPSCESSDGRQTDGVRTERFGRRDSRGQGSLSAGEHSGRKARMTDGHGCVSRRERRAEPAEMSGMHRKSCEGLLQNQREP